MSWFAALVIRPVAVVAVAWLILKVFRVQHPASQHAVWSCALAGMLIIGPLSFVMPRWSLELMPAKQTPVLHAAVAEPEPAAPCEPGQIAAPAISPSPRTPARPSGLPSRETWLLMAYAAGVSVLAAKGLIGRLLLARLIRRSKPLCGRLRESAEVVVPVTAGLLFPTVVLPAGWRQWPGSMRRLVLRHEFAHIRRGDLLTAALAEWVRNLLWFHPVAWLLSRRVRILAEMACDASVVEMSASPGAYCRMLVEFTEQVSVAGHRASVSGLAMAGQGGNLNMRIERVFAASRGRLRKLARPRLVLALGMAPALLVAAALEAGESPTPRLGGAPLRLLMSLQGEYAGRLKPELVPNSRKGQTEPMKPATPQQRAALPVSLAPEDLVFSGSTFFPKHATVKLALVEPARGDRYLFADVNQNGSFDQDEKFLFQGAELPAVVLKLPMTGGRYPYFPIRLYIHPEYYTSDNPGGRMLFRSPFVFVEGTVNIDGRAMLVRYMFDWDKGAAYPDYGWQGMDTNGDGRIVEGTGPDSEETFAHDEIVIFHVNGRGFSTASLDSNAGTFVLREHPAGENQWVLLKAGAQVPDFTFTDLDGKPHQFSEFRGKYVLLNFWGTWCGPCRRELAVLEKAYQQFRSRGLVVLGMGDDKDTNKARKMLAEAGVTYPQSSGETGNALVYKRFRINQFPTLVLLDPTGRVLAPDSDALHSDKMTSTLDRLLPRAQ